VAEDLAGGERAAPEAFRIGIENSGRKNVQQEKRGRHTGARQHESAHSLGVARSRQRRVPQGCTLRRKSLKRCAASCAIDGTVALQHDGV